MVSDGECFEQSEEFQAGRIAGFVSEWKKLTSDTFIIDMVKGVEIPLTELNDVDGPLPTNQVQGNQKKVLDQEIQKLLKMGVLEKSEHEDGEILSPVFLVKKPDGSFRLILNLKKFNENVVYEHFKMENLSSATQMMKENCFMASVDLRHAYYSVSVHPSFRKFLKFQWQGHLYAYTCLPNGLACCPRFFTKLLKPVYAHLRSQGFLSAAFIDDCYLQGQTFEECKANVEATVQTFQRLGFVVHKEKSVFTPCKKVKYLGVWLNSETMRVTLPVERIEKIKTACLGLKMKRRFTIRELSQVIGQLVAAFSAVLWGPLFYRSLDALKTSALKQFGGDFEKTVQLNTEAEKELDWWLNEIDESYYPLQLPSISVEITTDASTVGYGATCQNEETNGRWKKDEKKMHINCLELLAIKYALQSFRQLVVGQHVKVLCDNTCAVTYIRNMGGSRSVDCNKIAREIWFWCKERNVWLTISHIPGKENTKADQNSRKFNDRTEWSLNRKIFQKISERVFTPNIDLFASRMNFQLKPFVSWMPDPEAFAVDAFTISWRRWLIYAFPPFSLVLRCLKKLEEDAAEGVFIVPLWPTAVWFPLLLDMLIKEPVMLPQGRSVLQLPHTDSPHPLHRKLQLLACVCSGDHSKRKVFRDRLQKSCWHRGEMQQKDSTPLIWRDGKCFVVGEKLIQLERL